MSKRVTVAIESQWVTGLVGDIERYYQDHLYTMELVWTETVNADVARTVDEQFGTIPPGTVFCGMVIPSIDREFLYVRVSDGLKGPDGKDVRFLAHRLPLANLAPDLRPLVIEGIQNRIGWAFVKTIWPELDVRAKHYELCRPDWPPLARRSEFMALVRFTVELIVKEVIPRLTQYHHCPEIFSRFADQLVARLIVAEHPDELRQLSLLKQSLFRELNLACRAKNRGHANG